MVRGGIVMELTDRPFHGVLYAPAENPFYVAHDKPLLSAGMVSSQACQRVRLYNLCTVYAEATHQITEGRGFTQCFGLDKLLCKGNSGIIASQNLILSAGGAWYIVGLVNIESGSGTNIAIAQYRIGLSSASSHEAVILQHQAIEPARDNYPSTFRWYIGIIQCALEVYQITIGRIGCGNANWCSRGTNLHTGRLMERSDILVDYVTQCIESTCHSAIYQIINTRLITGKKTVISTNLSPNELGRRYGAPVLSRLQGEYQLLLFFGEDIRRQKRR